MINIAIVEDEKKASDLLLSYFDDFTKENEEKFHIVVYEDPVIFLENYKSNYDMVFMDIELPHINGMEASKKLRRVDKTVTLIFVTNMSQFAVEGYAVDAFDYIVKPLSYYDFSWKLERALRARKGKNSLKLRVYVDNMAYFVESNSLKYVEVTNHRLIYHTTEKDYETTGSLKELEEKLAPYGFVKCNNCYLVNLRFVTAIKDFTVMVDKDELQISHPRKKEFKRALNDYLGENF